MIEPNEKRIVVYIAGPFRAPDAWGIETNIREAECLGLEIARAGAIPLIPHSMLRYFQGTLPDHFWLDATLELLRRCDALLLGPRWKESAGAREELNEAKVLGMPFLEYEHARLALDMALDGLSEEIDDWRARRAEMFEPPAVIRRDGPEVERLRALAPTEVAIDLLDWTLSGAAYDALRAHVEHELITFNSGPKNGRWRLAAYQLALAWLSDALERGLPGVAFRGRMQ